MSSAPPLPHRASSPRLFMALMCVSFYCTTVVVLFCFSLSLCHVFSRCLLFVSLSLTLTSRFLSQSHAPLFYSSVVAQRQVVISACFFSVSSLFILLRHCFSLLLFFCVPFFSLLLLLLHCHHLSFSFLAVFPLFPLFALPSYLHSFPRSWPPSSSFLPPPHYPPPLSPAPGCQTLPSRPRGKAKAVDFSPHQAFWQLYLLSLCCLCRPKCRQASLATKTFSNWQIITCTRY